MQGLSLDDGDRAKNNMDSFCLCGTYILMRETGNKQINNKTYYQIIRCVVEKNKGE